MGVVYDALLELSPARDAELLDGYRRYESLLAGVLTHEQMETYAKYLRQSGTIRVFDEMTPDEFAALGVSENVIATTIMADENVALENRRVASLLNQRGQHEVAPDLDWNHEPLAGGPPV